MRGISKKKTRNPHRHNTPADKYVPRGTKLQKKRDHKKESGK